ncbi:hypothetical protein GW17_00001311 [Ensete ventricosum]|nr:hypothetical protein GW17_00001311 [Ensete ventricosum]
MDLEKHLSESGDWVFGPCSLYLKLASMVGVAELPTTARNINVSGRCSVGVAKWLGPSVIPPHGLVLAGGGGQPSCACLPAFKFKPIKKATNCASFPPFTKHHLLFL